MVQENQSVKPPLTLTQHNTTLIYLLRPPPPPPPSLFVSLSLWMESQRSLSLKSRRLLFFAVSSSFLFCFLFYYCLLNIAPLLPNRTHFQSSPCNKTKEASFGETFFLEATNLSQQTFDLTLPAKDVMIADIHVEENNGNVSGEVLDVRNGEEEVRGNASSLELIESVKRPTDVAQINLSNPNLKNGSNVLEKNQYSDTSTNGGENNEKITDSDVNKIKREVEQECNIYDGKWVFDESYPLYGSKSCSFIDEGFSCEANGRTDRDYMKWRWKPNRCDIPR